MYITLDYALWTFSGEKMTENNLQIQSAAVSDKGLSKKRPQNEDSFLEQPRRGLFVVADGVGGAQAGDVASQMAVETLGEAFANLSAGGDAEELMKTAIERANEAIYGKSHNVARLSTMATTVVALYVAGNIATIGHVGDSRLYRMDAAGNLYRETQDHSVVEEEMRAGRMTAAQAANHPSRNIISRALGADAVVEVDMKTIMFEPNTTFLLCSDGITRHIEDAEIGELLLSGAALENITKKMKQICYERGAEDNLTAVIVKTSGAANESLIAPGNVLNSSAATTAPVKFLANQTVSAERNAAPHDYEEPTVATARPLSATNSEVAPAENLSGETVKLTDEDFATSKLPAAPATEFIPNSEVIQTQTVPLIVEEDAAVPRVVEEAPIVETVVKKEKIETPLVNESSVAETVYVEKIAVVRNASVETNVKSGRAVDEGSSGFLGKLLSSLLLLIVGGILGAGLYYLFLQNNKPAETPPQVIQEQSTNTPLASFEEARRAVDKNSEQFIAASANGAPPADAESFYLLGRANLLSGKFPEAKNLFEQAKDRLAQTGDANAKVLGHDIDAGLVIVGVPLAQEEFKKTLTVAADASASPQANSNTQTNVNNNLPNQNSNAMNGNFQNR